MTHVELSIDKEEFKEKLGIKDGAPGKDSIVPGPKGDKGDKGDAGSPDTPDDIIEKVNAASKKIDPKQIKGLSAALKFVDDYGKNPSGAAGGGPTYKFRSNGTLISEHVTELNFGANITATYAGDGRVDLTASAGGGTGVVETIVAGTNVTVDATDPANPIVSAVSTVDSVNGQTGVVELTSADITGLSDDLAGKVSIVGDTMTGELVITPSVGARALKANGEVRIGYAQKFIFETA